MNLGPAVSILRHMAKVASHPNPENITETGFYDPTMGIKCMAEEVQGLPAVIIEIRSIGIFRIRGIINALTGEVIKHRPKKRCAGYQTELGYWAYRPTPDDYDIIRSWVAVARGGEYLPWARKEDKEYQIALAIDYYRNKRGPVDMQELLQHLIESPTPKGQNKCRGLLNKIIQDRYS